MKFIKSCWGKKDNWMVSVRTNTYGCSLAHVQNMLAVLRTDHPDQKIDPEDVTVVIYNTPSFKGIMGIEYSTKHPNKTYFKVNIAPCIF